MVLEIRIIGASGTIFAAWKIFFRQGAEAFRNATTGFLQVTDSVTSHIEGQLVSTGGLPLQAT